MKTLVTKKYQLGKGFSIEEGRYEALWQRILKQTWYYLKGTMAIAWMALLNLSFQLISAKQTKLNLKTGQIVLPTKDRL